MAKKPGKATTSLESISDSANIPVIQVPPGGTLTVIVDVGPMTIPYAVAYAGQTMIKALVDRAKLIQPLLAGDRTLAWAFGETEKGWHHEIGVSVNDGAVQVLEQKSEANKDPDHSVGFAIVRASEVTP